MNDQKHVNETLSSIFTEIGLVDVICSLYEKQLTSVEIGILLDLDHTTIENNLNQLINMNLVKKIKKNNTELFMVTNPKLCDSILMLKDALYLINAETNIGSFYLR